MSIGISIMHTTSMYTHPAIPLASRILIRITIFRCGTSTRIIPICIIATGTPRRGNLLRDDLAAIRDAPYI